MPSIRMLVWSGLMVRTIGLLREIYETTLFSGKSLKSSKPLKLRGMRCELESSILRCINSGLSEYFCRRLSQTYRKSDWLVSYLVLMLLQDARHTLKPVLGKNPQSL